jgi:AcrR family transcriptional regulator
MEQVIVETAERLFLEKGFSGTSTTDIARKAGCNQALIHYYFRTKEKLFNVIFEKKLIFFLEQLLKVHSESVGLKERIRLMIESHFDLIAANPQFPGFITSELLASPKRLTALKGVLGDKPNLLIESLQAQIDAEVQKGGVRPIRALDLLLSMIMLNVGLFIYYPMIKNVGGLKDEDMKKSVESRKKENVIMILNSLKPD